MSTVEGEAMRAATGGGRDGTAASAFLPIEDFLAIVGGRVRHHRTSVRMSRRLLAERSGVSERYLAQLECGQGNMSIALLRKVALALELPLPELVAEEQVDPLRRSSR